MTTRSPLAPAAFPALPDIAGVTRRVARAQYKNWDRCDLTYVELAPGTTVAGVFTRNVCCSSEVELGREQVKGGIGRALIVNAGNSNAFTGYRGREAVEQIMAQVADHLGCDASEVFVSSTGVIGVPLPKDKARAGVEAALDRRSPARGRPPPKRSAPPTPSPRARPPARWSATRTVHVAGIVKGSGMIAPDMATMLGYIFTDAAVAPALLQDMLSEATGGDVQQHHRRQRHLDQRHRAALRDRAGGQRPARPPATIPAPMRSTPRSARSALDLAQQVVRDGEGASKFIEVQVSGAVSDDSAKRVALAHRQLAAGEDRDRGRGRQLGPRRDGGGQGGRTRRPRQARDPLRRSLGRRRMACRSTAMTKPRSRRI